MTPMNIGSLYFTPSFSSSDRQSFFCALGLDQLPFLYIESVDSGAILSAMEVSNGTGSPLLEPTELNELGDLTCESGATVLLEHTEGHLACVAAPSIPSLWRDLFPFPFNAISYRFNPVAGIRLSLRPASFSEKIAALNEALVDLEQHMMRFEVSILTIKRETRSFPTLFHYVRSKRIRVGTSEVLKDLAARVDRNEIGASDVRQFFGTRVGWFELDLQANEATDPVQRVLSAIERMVLPGPPETGFSPGIAAPHPEISL